MSKPNPANRKTRTQNAFAAISAHPMEAIGNSTPVRHDDSALPNKIQPGFDFDGTAQDGSPDNRAGLASSNRIQFASAADLDLSPPVVAVASHGKPVGFARHLAEAPMRMRAAAIALVAERVSVRFRGIIRSMAKRFLQRPARCRKLQLLEIQQLGEKRFIAIARVGKQKFLIGGAATSVSLLAEIDSHKTTVIASRPLDQASA